MPSASKMLRDTETKTKALWKGGRVKSKTHVLGWNHKDYYKELADIAAISNIPDVYADIYTDALQNLMTNAFDYRSTRYTILNNTTFRKEKITTSAGPSKVEKL